MFLNDNCSHGQSPMHDPLRGGYTPYNGKKIQIGPRASIFGYVIDLSKCYNF